MVRFVIRLAAAATLFLGGALAASAHPHVWVTMKSEVVYAADGAATGVRQAWTFDDMNSTAAVMGIESKEKGKYTREELAPIAKAYVESMEEFDYFTMAQVNGKREKFKKPVEAWADFADGLLTLHFTLPFAAPVKAQRLEVEVFDATWLVDFSFAEQDAGKLVGAPDKCQLAVLRPGDGQTQTSSTRLSEAFNSLAAGNGAGNQYSSRLMVKCP